MNSELKVFMLTEGGARIGFGHITRCFSLCQAFEEHGVIPHIIVHGDEAAEGILKSTPHTIRNWQEADAWLLNFLRGADIIVIDSYTADRDAYERLSKSVKIPVYMDDNKRIEYPGGILVNGSINAETLAYIQKEGCEYLLGAKYVPLRKAFWDVPEKEIRGNVGSIMVTFGGDDIRNMTPRVLELLVREFPGLSRQIVIGKGYHNTDQIEAVADANTKLHYHPDAEAMRNIMLTSDIAISAGGQTLYELARIGVPAIAIAVADNQMNNIKGWQNAGYIEYAGWWEDGEVFNNIVNSLKTVKGQDVRTRLSQTGRSLVDGQGAKRIVDYLVGIK